MSEQHVVLRVGRGDRYAPKNVPRSRVVFTLDGRGNPRTDIQQKHLWESLARLELSPPQAAIDLHRICAAVYCADHRLPRSDAYDAWTRQIVLHAPVADLGAWSPHVETLTRLLDYLSGDVWRVELRERETPAPPVKPRRRKSGGAESANQLPIDGACLFSGGLDSFIGAADATAAGRNLLLVSHNPEGVSRFASPAQDVLREGMQHSRRTRRLEHMKVTINPPRPTGSMGKENTQRARSILFFGLGTLAAASVGAGTPLSVPENGFISLNLPLTPGRIGSLSTRTTHPYVIDLYRALLRGLGIRVSVEVPYLMRTKGEMLDCATDRRMVHEFAGKSVSCASPNPRSAARESHCGYCVPCIIRRSAMNRVGLDSPADYRLDVRRKKQVLTPATASHVLAFRMAIQRHAGGVSVPALLAAGALPRSLGSLADFQATHDRGLAEVASFLGESS